MIKDLVVQLTGSDEDAERLAITRQIAGQFGSHVVGAHLHVLPDILDVGDPSQSGYIQTVLEKSNEAAERTHVRLQEEFAHLDCSNELRRLHGMTSDVAAGLASIARNVDLFVGTRPYGDPHGRHRIEEAVLFGSGRGCLFLPPGGTKRHDFDTIMVAYDGSREASRAVAEAMPLLARASQVIIGQIADPDSGGDQSVAGLVRHLRRYGIETTTALAPYRSNTGEGLEQLAHQKGADLIVMGAYGHSRFQEWAFGGATRQLLAHAMLPLLMAH